MELHELSHGKSAQVYIIVSGFYRIVEGSEQHPWTDLLYLSLQSDDPVPSLPFSATINQLGFF